MINKLFSLICLVLFVVSTTRAEEDNSLTSQAIKIPVISIIIDDLGDRISAGERAVSLPGALTYSFLPHTPYASYLAKMAHNQHKEVMLHLPMEAIHQHDIGEGGLTLEMSHQEFTKTVKDTLTSIPYMSGINNHMGSLLTQYPDRMQWLMQEISARGNLFFIDSRTSNQSVANILALQFDIPNTSRDIFLDNDQDTAAINKQFQKLISMARNTGMAIAIAHPYPETLAMLEKEIPALRAKGIQLVSVSNIIKLKQQPNQHQPSKVITAKISGDTTLESGRHPDPDIVITY